MKELRLQLNICFTQSDKHSQRDSVLRICSLVDGEEVTSDLLTKACQEQLMALNCTASFLECFRFFLFNNGIQKLLSKVDSDFIFYFSSAPFVKYWWRLLLIRFAPILLLLFVMHDRTILLSVNSKSSFLSFTYYFVTILSLNLIRSIILTLTSSSSRLVDALELFIRSSTTSFLIPFICSCCSLVIKLLSLPPLHWSSIQFTDDLFVISIRILV